MCIKFEGALNEKLCVLLSALEIWDFVALSAKAQRIESAIQERNKVRDKKRNKCGASGTITNVGFKRPNDVKDYSTTLVCESQTIGFH